MIKYHPETRFLTDYAAGSLPKSQALCVAAHIHYCDECKIRLNTLTEIGTELFVSLDPLELKADSFDKLLSRIDTDTDDGRTKDNSLEKDTSSVPVAEPGKYNLPLAINKLVKGDLDCLSWSKIGKSFKFSNLRTGDRARETSLFHISAGHKVPKHHHKGDEITVVLDGSFSDDDDHYHQGDFIVRTRGESHTPVAAQNGDCLCLSTLDAPIVMNNWFYRLLMSFINRPATA